MLSPETDKLWTAEFAPGSYFEGSWGAVRELLAAWNTIAVATADADAAAMVQRLQALRLAVERKFPDARKFVRPGFDEEG